ncbi:lipid kinase YegS [Pseudoxanthomonas winnipegensis]|jgi:lipid kinase YegS|uniref:Probable lipid kinase YegS-like n=1 Tax=Pseudoxanthomonas winnipegensis TaxID=2480810 RepID=A0A4V2HE45_9GAMM|nr:lipid kinase YegS [Pseudoxanthomonas winnipegensis]RZZ85132.1 lipid kinase YegS [Pseudoxanthomonas winnipegensis]TAA11869.1 lipid kinase YegS [Pseudoxanthomonas winnipegensis]TAA19768.1 lipid kinase YegS [Pseudoxanthomonas winnipegensis]TAA30953.1 lipid kinase YegS [Pseudoxanthomonas winnipegensis]TAA38692.1 lipid kinase YegS [Pseudoxanthomonas winnipegensis]
MSQPRWCLILNGKAAGNDAVRAAVTQARERGARLDVRVTWESGDAERYVTEAIADGVDTVIAGGGDGTLSEVATTLAHRDEGADALPALALLPLGTANDFATAAELPLEPQAALALIAAAPARPIDLLRVTADHGPHWCANMATGGFGTQVTVETDEAMKRVLGGLAYVVTGLSRLGRVEPMRARFRGPDFAWEGSFIALGLGNGRQAGGGQALCPDALVDDGLLELTIVPELTGAFAATLGTLITGGKRAALEQAAVRARLPWVEIDVAEPITLNLDGEPETSRHFRVDCVPGRLRMHLPDGCPLLA